jgi:Ca2+-binding RTX toxin-like protein
MLSIGDDEFTYSPAAVAEFRIRGHAGDDAIAAAAVAEIMKLWGGDDDDTFTGGLQNDSFDGGAGSDTVVETAANLTLTNTNLTASGVDALTSIEQAHLIGTAAANKLDAKAFTLGPVTLDGLAGADTLTGGQGSDVLRGGAGNDKYVFVAATAVQSDTVEENAGAGTDTLDFSKLPASVSVTVDLSDAAAIASHGAGATLRTVVTPAGKEGNLENATGGAASDSLTGNGAKNVLTGGKGDDTIDGAGGDDTLKDGAGDDLLKGGAGNDIYAFAAAVGSENDTVEEISGTDTLNFAALGASTPLTADLTVNGALAVHTGRTVNGDGDDFENVTGGKGNDSITGNGSANKLDGKTGDDAINGLAGNDTLAGGGGADTFHVSGTDSADDIDVLLKSGKVKVERRTVGSTTLLEVDTITTDAADFIHVLTLDGDDEIEVSASVTTPGQVDGGEGADACSLLPDGWDKINCES